MTALSVQDPPVAPAEVPRPVRRWPAVVPGLGSALAMLGVALIGAGRPVLSWDEVTSADVAGRTPAQIWHLVHDIDAVHGAYYLFLHYWTAVAGTSEPVLRLPSIVAMAAAAGLTAELARRLSGPAVAGTAGLILALLPNTSRYAAEARQYAFVCLFSALAVLLLHLALERPSRWRWTCYGVTVAALGLSHVLALATLAGHAAFVLARSRLGREARVWAGTVAVAVLPALPVALLGSRQQEAQLHWLEPLTTQVLRAGPAAVVGAAETAWLLIGLAVLGVRGRSAPLAVLALAPPVVLAVLSVVDSPVWVARYLLVVLAPLAILAAVATGRSLPRIAAVLLLVGTTAYPAQVAVRSRTAKAGPDFRGIAAVIREHQRPGDVLIYQRHSRFLRAGMEYYLRGGPADVLRDVPGARRGWLTAKELPVTAGRLAGAPRVWVLLTAPRDPADAQPGLRAVLDAGFRRAGLWSPVRSKLALYERSR